MTRRTNARIAGFTFLFYIAVAFPSMVLFNRATGGEGIAAKLATLAQHAADVHLAVVLSLLGCLSALVLAVTLYAITREQDPDLALLALTCRVAEGVIGAVSISETLGVLWLATGTGTSAPDAAAAQSLAAFLLRPSPLVGAAFFAVGSTFFCLAPAAWPDDSHSPRVVGSSSRQSCWSWAFPWSLPPSFAARSPSSCGCRWPPSRFHSGCG